MFIRNLIAGGMANVTKANSRRNHNASKGEHTRPSDNHLFNYAKEEAKFIRQQIEDGLQQHAESKKSQPKSEPAQQLQAFNNFDLRQLLAKTNQPIPMAAKPKSKKAKKPVDKKDWGIKYCEMLDRRQEVQNEMGAKMIAWKEMRKELGLRTPKSKGWMKRNAESCMLIAS